MIDEITLDKLLENYNFKTSLGPNIYSNNNDLGIVLDIKDSKWGYLTRAFILDSVDDAEEFLKKYRWLCDNKKESVSICLNDYQTKYPKLIYKLGNKELNLEELLNFEKFKKEYLNKMDNIDLKSKYLANIKQLTNFLINLKKIKYNTILEKQKLKKEEYNLKYDLMNFLAIYYGKEKKIEKRELKKEEVMDIEDTSLYLTNIKKMENKSEEEIKNYLITLINIIKNEELEDEYLINLYSNEVYSYNINILKKQINFVQRKIKSEKNFNAKGSKIHNIDEELKSFLNTENMPLSVEKYLKLCKDNIKQKYNNLNLENSYEVISNDKLNMQKKEDQDSLKFCLTFFDNLSLDLQSICVLFNSFYKDIINYILKNNPSIEKLKSQFDWNYYYKYIEEIIYRNENIHFSKYFNILSFKTLDDFIFSLMSVAKKMDDVTISLPWEVTGFLINDEQYYNELGFNPIYDLENKVLIKLKENYKFIFAPLKLQIDNNIIVKINCDSLYCLGHINMGSETFKINIYEKNKAKKDKGIVYIDDLKLKKTVCFKMGYIGEEE